MSVYITRDGTRRNPGSFINKLSGQNSCNLLTQSWHSERRGIEDDRPVDSEVAMRDKVS
jgi:hypothetical protein